VLSQHYSMSQEHSADAELGAVLSPAGALASPVTGRCPAQPRQSGIVVVHPGGRGGLARET
jgi:hypothetical protein